MRTSWALGVGLVAVVASIAAVIGVAAPDGGGVGPRDIIFHYEWVGDIDRVEFNEPSGIVYHTGRGTLLAVGDEGDLCEIETDGALLKRAHVRNGDFEGVTFDPATGLLYVAVEGEEKILEIAPDSFEVLREFAIERTFEGATLLGPGGQGIEGITFVPDASHPEGGTFYAANQAYEPYPPDDPSVIVELVLPLRTGGEEIVNVAIARAFDIGIPDIAGFHYDAESDHILIVSDGSNALFELTRDCEVLRGWAFPGDNQEGIAIDPEGFVYIAQDSGGILKVKWQR
jgi:uncharacterized protein YjiK